MSVKKNSRGNLIEEFDVLFSQCDGAFKQSRTAKRARQLAYGLLNCLGRQTLTGLLTASGQQFTDWSAAYRLFQGDRLDIDHMFAMIQKQVVDNQIDMHEPIYAHMDDTLLRKTGKKVAGTAWRRDPLGPPFHTNFIWGQRFIQLSMSLPDTTGASISRAIPVDFQHCPTAKKPRKKDDKKVWDAYKESQKQLNLSKRGLERIQALRESLDQNCEARDKELILSVDGSYTNETILKGLPKRVTLIGRIRKDAKLSKLPEPSKRAVGRSRVYGDDLPTPEQIRKSDQYDWQKVKAWAAGKTHQFDVKVVKNVRWRKAGKQNLQLVIIRPLSYRLTKGSRLLYRKPAYLICTDAGLTLDKLLQGYLWRWEIEVNFRDEKTLIGCGKTQVRAANPVQKVPAFFVAIYSLIHLAAYKSDKAKSTQSLPASKWYPDKKRNRQTTGDILNNFRTQMWAESTGIKFSNFVNLQNNLRSTKNSANPTLSAVFYARN